MISDTKKRGEKGDYGEGKHIKKTGSWKQYHIPGIQQASVKGRG